MATTDLQYTGVNSNSGWTNVADVASSNDTRATGGVADDVFVIALDNAPTDFASLNSVQLFFEARAQGTVIRDKNLLIELLDSGSTVLETYTTGAIPSQATDTTGNSSAFTRTDSSSTIDGYQLRVTVQEGGGMPDTATVEVDHVFVRLDYDPIIDASGSPSIDKPTATGDAVIPITADGTPSVTKPTASGAAEVEKTATGAPSLTKPTSTGVVEVVKTATGTPSLTKPTSTGSAKFEWAASGSPTLDAITAAGASTRIVTNTGTPALTAITSSGNVSVPFVDITDVANSGETPGSGSENWQDGSSGNVISGTGFA